LNECFRRCGRRGAAIAAVFAIIAAWAAAPVAQRSGGNAGQQAAPAAGAADRWEPTIKKFEDQDKVTPPPQNAIVFIGASSIVRWDLPQYFPELGPKAINRGFGGSVMADSVRYADRIVIPYKPRIVVLYAGDNDVEAGSSAKEIADGFTQF